MNELKTLLFEKISRMPYWEIVDNENLETINVENIVNEVCNTISWYFKGGAE